MDHKSYRILIFEDDYDLAQQWNKALCDRGYVVSHAISFDEASQYCKSYKFDLIICDIFIRENSGHLAGLGGISLIQLGRAHGTGNLSWMHEVPIIVVTGGVMADRGTDRYSDQYENLVTLIKPFTPTRLIECVETLLKTAENSHK